MGVGGLEVYWGRAPPFVMPVRLVEVPSPSAPKAPVGFDVTPLPGYPMILGIFRIPLTKPRSNVGFLSFILLTEM